jgi:hypothetical protein
LHGRLIAHVLGCADEHVNHAPEWGDFEQLSAEWVSAFLAYCPAKERLRT